MARNEAFRQVRRRRPFLVGAAALVAAALFASIGPTPPAAEGPRPSAAALIAGAKQTPLGIWASAEEIKHLRVGEWLSREFGQTARIEWRSKSCHIDGPSQVLVDSPVCVEAVVRYRRGVVFILGIGFDGKQARPEQHPNALWGEIYAQGRGCEFLRHPDHMVNIRVGLDEIVKNGGKCG